MLPTLPNMSGQRQNTRYTTPDEPVGNYTSGGLAGSEEFAVHDQSGQSSYMDSPSGSWAPRLRQVPGGVPDPMRTQQMPQRDYRPTPLNQAPSRWWNSLRGVGGEKQARHTGAEFVDADGWEMTRGVGGPGKRAAPDSRRTPPDESRVTQKMSPSRYVFTRPFDQHAARTFNGIHFSMADHRRNYPVLGMQPISRPRNTYRIDPAPWDTDIVDMAPENEPTVAPARIQQVELPQALNRSWRLG